MNWAAIKTWALVAFAVVALFCLGQWQRMAALVRETKAKLAQEKAARIAAQESAERERELAEKRTATDTSLREHIAAIEGRRRSELDASEKRRSDVEHAAGDVDKLVALGEKLRKDGKLK